MMNKREILANLIAPALRITGFRFSTEYRHAETGFKAFVYKNVNTIAANRTADNQSRKQK